MRLTLVQTVANPKGCLEKIEFGPGSILLAIFLEILPTSRHVKWIRHTKDVLSDIYIYILALSDEYDHMVCRCNDAVTL